MELLKWFVGATTDPKFAVVAKRSGQNMASVIAVWAMLLERAGQADERGRIDGFDCEGADTVLGLEDGAACSIMQAMQAKGLIDGGCITNWDKRQRREEPEAVKERKRLQREREKLAAELATLEKARAELLAASRNVTPCHAESHDVTDVTHKRREDKKEEIQGGGYNAGARIASFAPEIPPETVQGASEEKNPADSGSAVLVQPFSDTPATVSSMPKRTDCPSKGNPQWQCFLSCWQVYPVKQGQEAAWREWMRLHGNGTLAEPYVIRDAIILLAQEDSRWQRGKVPNMAKWLNGKGWNDLPFAEPAAAQSNVPRDGPPVARTQAQRNRQNLEGLAAFVRAAEKELTHGNTTAHIGRIGTHGHSLPAAN